jgi:glycosyltransferase involved in cell wall biosynthesis
MIEQTLALREMGHDVRILSVLSDPLFQPPVKTYYQSNVALKKRPTLKLAVDFFISRLRPLRFPGEFKPEVVISHNFADASRFLQLQHRTGGFKLALFVHDPWTFYPYARPDILLRSLSWKFEPSGVPLVRVEGSRLRQLVAAEKNILKSADLVLTNSFKTQESLLRNYGISRTDSTVLHYGAHPEPTIPNQRGDFVLIGGTSLEVGRNFELAFKAAGMADAKVVLAGRKAPTTALLLRALKEECRRYDVVFSDYLPSHGNTGELRRLFQTARVYLNPSEESFAIRTLEAASFGCPIIQNANCGSSELFIHGLDGFFPQEIDAKLYANYISKFRDELKAWTMGKHAWETARKHTWKDHANKLVQSLEKIC